MSTLSADSPPVPEAPALSPPQRLESLDAFRGAIMLLMASGGLGLAKIAESFPDSGTWQLLGHQSDHVPWAGCVLWDLIQPAFMFMVGVALPWSVANRQARGQKFPAMFGHAAWRAALLVMLAVFLTSAWSKQTQWVFTNVLGQIGLGYPFLFLIAFTRPRVTWLITLMIIVGYWLLFAMHPLPAADFDWKAVGVPANWPHFTGFAAHWEKNANFATSFDLWFLNLFPRSEPFTFNNGGYHTLNFIPSLATMSFGLMAGRLLRSEIALPRKFIRLVIAGLIAVVVGKNIELAGLCPIVKRIWTPSWVLYSTGWVTLMLAAFVAIVDGAGFSRCMFPLIVVGLNPISMYCLSQLSSPFIRKQLQIHLGQDLFATFGETWIPMMERALVLLVFWLVVWFMYRRKIFLRI